MNVMHSSNKIWSTKMTKEKPIQCILIIYFSKFNLIFYFHRLIIINYFINHRRASSEFFLSKSFWLTFEKWIPYIIN